MKNPTVTQKKYRDVFVEYEDDGSPIIRGRQKNGKDFVEVRSQPVGYEGIARLGTYFATTEYWNGIFPRLFTINEIKKTGKKVINLKEKVEQPKRVVRAIAGKRTKKIAPEATAS